MSQSNKMMIKVVCVLIVFLPYKFLIVAGQKTSFLQDFLVALGGFLLANVIIAAIEKRNSGGDQG